MQSTNTIMMVRPVDFAFNAETAKDNEFQNDMGASSQQHINQQALQEFDDSVRILREEHGVNVIVLGKSEKNADKQLPDAVYPNNWISTHTDGTIVVYPMFAKNRRIETESLDDALHEFRSRGLKVGPVVRLDTEVFSKNKDGDGDEQQEQEFLESTGSMIIDHLNRTVYAAKSIRTSPKVLQMLFDRTGFYDRLVLFDTQSSTGKPFYHTNIIMAIGTKWAVVCGESIVDNELCTREQVMDELKRSGRDVIDISLEQTERHFCGNILEVRGRKGPNDDGEVLIVMSERAYKGFTEEQRAALSKHGKIVALPITDAIEHVGGGSARCMLCEVYLPPEQQQQEEQVQQ